ncbi:MAG: MBL fold metallo-hydrolase [Blastocatellia bacterium]|nr:MBL fold metallo-hydrolase [Blastocatellia bacterium]
MKGRYVILLLSLAAIASVTVIQRRGARSHAISQPVSTPVEVTYIANEGFLIASGEQKVLVDALVREGVKPYPVPSSATRERLEKAQSPFDGVDLVLASHFHPDHFDPLAVAEHLANNPQARFISTRQSVEKLKTAFDRYEAIESRVTGLLPKEGERMSLTHGGINLQILNIHHGRNRPFENLGLLFEVGGRKFLHIGDSEASADDFKSYDLVKDKIDVAFIPYWYFMSDDWKRAIRQHLKPAQIIVMHLPVLSEKSEFIEKRGGWTKVFSDIKAEFPNAVIFEKEMDKTVISGQ